MEQSEVREEEREGKDGRDYTRKVYQNLMEIVELLETKAPLPMTQKQLSDATGISKNVVFDVCWNLCKKGWAEDVGDGSVRLKKGMDEKLTYIGRMIVRMVQENFKNGEVGDEKV